MHEHISDFLKRNKIKPEYASIALDIIEKRDDIGKIVDGDNILYSNLGSILDDLIDAIDRNYINKNKIAIEFVNRKQYGHVYMMKALKDDKFTGIVKIGYARKPKDRLNSINKQWSEVGIRFEPYIASEYLDDAYSVEQSIHCILIAKNMQFKQKYKLTGHTELFHYEPWMDNLIPRATK